MITAVIIDDMQKNVLLLGRLLQEYCRDIKVVGTANNARDGKNLISEAKPQLVFLDIEMPYGNGFSVLGEFPIPDFEVIFITAYNQYALNAFRFSALDYLLKPISIAQLKEAAGKAHQRIKEKTALKNMVFAQDAEERQTECSKIILIHKGLQYGVSPADILYCIADGSYTHVKTSSHTFLSSKNLKDIEGLLPADMFLRIHHSYIINKKFVHSIIQGKNGQVIMKDGKTLEIAVRRKSRILKDIFTL